MRGNLQTRLRKLEEGHCDALLLAYAGVHRMGYENKIAEYLSLEEFTPAVGQGSVAIECAVSLDAAKKDVVGNLLNHVETRFASAPSGLFCTACRAAVACRFLPWVLWSKEKSI